MTEHIVVFDIGGVLCEQGMDFRKAAELLGASDAERVAAAYWAYRDDYDLGQSDLGYWQRIAGSVRAVPPVTASTAARLAEMDSRRWAVVVPEAVPVLEELLARGSRLGLLSNAPTALARVAKAATWSQGFEHRLFSSESGLMKPDPLIYQELLERWWLPAERIVFFDDRRENVLAAAQRGIRAELFTGFDAVRRVLEL